MHKFLLLFILLPFVSNGQVIRTFAGNGAGASSGDGAAATAAGVYGPNGLAFDNSGNVYISEYYNHTIRKVSPSGVITTVGGKGTAGYSGDGAQATNAELSSPVKIAVDTSGNLYVAELGNNVIRKIAPSGIITTVAGTGVAGFTGDGASATLAKLSHPSGVSVDRSGNIYIADYFNSRIRKVSATGVITTIAGNGTAGSSGDGGMATAAQINQAWGVNADGLGNIYISDLVNNKIRKVSASGLISTFAGTGTAGFGGDGGQATAAMLYQPSAVAFDSSGNVFVADELNHRVRKISPTGIITTVAGTGVAGYSGDGGTATAAQLNTTNDIAFDHTLRLFICDNNNNRVRLIIDATTGIQQMQAQLISIFPNPTNGKMQIITPQANCNWIATLTDVVGNLVSKTAFADPSFEINANVNSGMYFLRFDNQTTKESIVKKIIIDK